MIRPTSVALVMILLSQLGAGSTRQAEAAPKASGDQARFYDFDELLIDGEFNKPTTIYTRALKSPLFDRLLRLQKSFLDQLGRTARDPGLRRFR